MNSTQIRSARIMRFTAFDPPPPTPMTLISAKFSMSDRSGMRGSLLRKRVLHVAAPPPSAYMGSIQLSRLYAFNSREGAYVTAVSACVCAGGTPGTHVVLSSRDKERCPTRGDRGRGHSLSAASIRRDTPLSRTHVTSKRRECPRPPTHARQGIRPRNSFPSRPARPARDRPPALSSSVVQFLAPQRSRPDAAA